VSVKTGEAEETLYLRRIVVDNAFITNLGIEIIAGKDFPPDISGNSRFCLINERAVQRLDLQSPTEAVGHEIIQEDGTTLHVIGVVKDFYLNRLTDSVEPCFLLGRASGFRSLNLRYRPGSEAEAIVFLEQTWQKIPVAPLLSFTSYKYQIEDELSAVSVSATVFRFVGILALLVACLGLLGIANYSARVKIKEIGIRKILGANTAGLVRLLSRDFMRLLLIATVIAVPIAYYVNSLFTQSFSNRAGLRIEYFLFAALLMVAFGLAAILSQTIRASLANPVDSLKHEE
jgi:putative ABC transport system permease protein